MDDSKINRPPRHTTPRKHRVVKYFLLTLLKIVARVDLQGLENLPDGPFVAVINHLSSFDTLTGIAVGPIRQATTFAAIEHRSDPIGGWILDQLGVIWVRRGEADRDAIKLALDELKSGTVMAMAIEGTRSRTGGLQAGKTGSAFLASRTHVPMIPGAIWGTEKIISNLKHLRRSEVHVRLGQPVHLPEARANTEQLEEYTDQVMLKIAAMLPSQYRGVYAERVKDALGGPPLRGQGQG
ncbi:MAG TPA: lysophospholipid acyltransferase family protein [Anaerolineae bacterium]|nr:lysophospholipid acyltransferase family protein [Anaerolineae bacterium]